MEFDLLILNDYEYGELLELDDILDRVTNKTKETIVIAKDNNYNDAETMLSDELVRYTLNKKIVNTAIKLHLDKCLFNGISLN